jgi:PIN domain nuclease of toxin-antitoxin system
LRLLLDTHILLWTIVKSPLLPRRAVELLSDPATSQSASAVNVWETAIKHARRRGGINDVPMSGRQLLDDLIGVEAEILPVLPTHAAAVDDLPPLHGDPFDRLLIAQARTESMHLLTHDQTLAAYGDFVIVV